MHLGSNIRLERYVRCTSHRNGFTLARESHGRHFTTEIQRISTGDRLVVVTRKDQFVERIGTRQFETQHGTHRTERQRCMIFAYGRHRVERRSESSLGERLHGRNLQTGNGRSFQRSTCSIRIIGESFAASVPSASVASPVKVADAALSSLVVNFAFTNFVPEKIPSASFADHRTSAPSNEVRVPSTEAVIHSSLLKLPAQPSYPSYRKPKQPKRLHNQNKLKIFS